MKIPLRDSPDVITGGEIFRAASLFLYLTLLLHIALSAYARHLMLADSSIIAVTLLSVLFFVALARYVWPDAVVYGQQRILLELSSVIAVISMLALLRSVPALPLPWLLGAAGVFPLVLESGVALGAILLIAVTGFGLNAALGVQPGDWLPHLFATVFVGLLSILLSKALNMNLSAISQARTNDRRFDAIARATRHVILITDAQYNVKYANPALQEVTGYKAEELKNVGPQPTIHPDDIKEHRRKIRFLCATPHSSIFSRHRTQHKDGHWVWLETSGYNLLHDSAINGLLFSSEDITARKDAERKLEEEHALLRTVLDVNPSMIYAKDAAGRFTISNLSFQRRFGFSSEEELRGKTSHELFLRQAADGHELDAYQMADGLHLQDLQVIQSGTPLEDREIQGFWENDANRWYQTNKYPLRDATGQAVGVLGITRDITERKEYEMRLEHQALHDPLTSLPNRRYLFKTIAEAITTAQERPVRLAMLFCDLDFFKSVNDTHGHDVGDKCLLEIARRIRAQLPAQDFVARFGGDEFVILARAGLPAANVRATALLEALSEPLVIGEVVVRIQLSIGIATLSPAHHSPSELIRDADAAMYQAKERGRNRAAVFDASLQNSTTTRAQMDVALRFALERNELALVYQPKVSMLDGSLKGFELLLRWDNPDYGPISPNEFIPIAEASGLVVPIGLWALEQACRQLSAWQAKYPEREDLTVAVNVSMRQLLQPSFLSDVTGILKKTGVAPHSIELELTETSVMANPRQTIENLSRLKALGLRLALDDFGTGYSSLAYLQKLPIDVLKIDQAFVHGLGKNQGDAEIVRLIVALAKALNIETIAEGVETNQHMVELKKMGCHLGQGFVFSAAISAAQSEELLRSSHRFAVA